MGVKRPGRGVDQPPHPAPRLKKDQYSETDVMHFLFSLLRIKGLYVFRALLAILRRPFTNGT
jgi:hypothetical protein